MPGSSMRKLKTAKIRRHNMIYDKPAESSIIMQEQQPKHNSRRRTIRDDADVKNVTEPLSVEFFSLE